MKQFLVYFVLAAALCVAQNFTNPVLWEDLADIDVFRVDDTFYYSASTMAYSPGAPILRSYDLVNWEFVGHSVPTLEFGDDADYNLNSGRAYVRGIWASFMNYRKSTSTFIWGGCIDFDNTYIYTAPAVAGPWEQSSVIDTCYYDAGLLIDDDDTMYVAYGSSTINVAQLSADGRSQVSTQAVFTSDIGSIEGSRFYKLNGNYYIFVTKPATDEWVLKSTSGPFGPYGIQPLVTSVGSPVPNSGNPHQGGIVDTPDGDWYYMSFIDAYPGGRIPTLAPVEWDADGWPSVTLVNGAWGASYPYPLAPHTVKSPTGTDTFSGSSLSHEWEWNHNPDNSKWSLSNGLNLQTATVTYDLFAARNTLTHRIIGPSAVGTIELDYSGMIAGDRAGFALFRDNMALIRVKNNDGQTSVGMVNDMVLNSDWTTKTTGTEVASAPISGGTVWLRIEANIAPSSDHSAAFSYSTDGINFNDLGPSFVMITDWHYFIGYRFGIFNYATLTLGGVVAVKSFTMELA